MVSKLWLVAISFVTVQAQSAPQQSNNFVEESRTGQLSAVSTPKPGNIVTPEMRGDIFMARKMYREAVLAYEEGGKTSAVLLNKTGIAYHQMMELSAAEKFYRAAIHTSPEYAEAINNLGTIHYARKSYRRAITEYKKALRITPKSASVWSNLGTGYFARKDYTHAWSAWQEALTLDPEVFEHRSTQGVLLQERSVDERAKFHYYLAKTYAKAGMNDRALLYIRKSIEEGFKERKKYQDDPEFAGLRTLPEFKELLAMEPRVL
jgi:tetratricopeptide (TPR) repeat protein